MFNLKHYLQYYIPNCFICQVPYQKSYIVVKSIYKYFSLDYLLLQTYYGNLFNHLGRNKMCGIAAIINPTPQGKLEMELMLKKIEHQGDTPPLQIQLGNCILGSVRLKIVDRLHGTQPFFNESKTVGVVFNGEIYNYKKLRSELQTKGHNFISDCDTEVLVHLYEEHGINFLEKLEGMFAFLIYDSIQNIFFGVRDFFGVKPFFYCKRNNVIYVSSEMKSFTELEVEIFEELKPAHY